MNVYQEPKYQIVNGQLVNRQSGIAIPPDEPLFVLRARDKHAARLLIEYCQLVQDPEHREAVRTRATQFSNWAILHSDRMKEPDSQKDDGWTSAGMPKVSTLHTSS